MSELLTPDPSLAPALPSIAFGRRQRARPDAGCGDPRTARSSGLRDHDLEAEQLATVQALVAAVAAKDDSIDGHARRANVIGLLLAEIVCPADVGDPQMAYGFLLHDIGKLAVPDAILNKPGRLDSAGWDLIRRHPLAGVAILAPITFLDRAVDVVRSHHERWDGAGYPDGLAGERIPIWARIFAVADAVDAITAGRPYRASRPYEAAVAEVLAQAGTQFDPACAKALASLPADRVRPLLQHTTDIRALESIPRTG